MSRRKKRADAAPTPPLCNDAPDDIGAPWLTGHQPAAKTKKGPENRTFFGCFGPW